MLSSSIAIVAHYTSRAFIHECVELAPPYALWAFEKFLDFIQDLEKGDAQQQQQQNLLHWR